MPACDLKKHSIETRLLPGKTELERTSAQILQARQQLRPLMESALHEVAQAEADLKAC